MPISPTNLARVSNLMRSDLARASINGAQQQLSVVQQQLSTGKRLAAPSDDVADAAIAQQVRKLLEQRDAYATNLQAADSQLSVVDTTMGSLNDLLREAQTLASQNVGSDVTTEERSASAELVDALLQQAVTLGNTQLNDVYLFGGDRSTTPPFVAEQGGVRWQGSSDVLSNRMDEGTDLRFQVDGAAVFGALSTRVRGGVDLAPTVTADTRLADLNGARQRGVRPGLIELGNGTDTTQLDLRSADTLGDVVARVNAAGLAGITATLDGDGITIDAAGGAELTVRDLGGDSMATDLGVLRPTGEGVDNNLEGERVRPRVTPLTPLARLNGGAGVDLTGLTITSGTDSAEVDLSGAETVEDLLNAINDSGLDVRAKVNAAGTGIDVTNDVQGVAMTIAELGAGTSAADLGIRSFTADARLADLNDGRGVSRSEDGPELRVTDSAGVAFDVELDGLNTVQDVLDRLNAGAASAGSGVSASFGSPGNGIILADVSVGAGTLTVASQNGSAAAVELGLDVPVSGGVIAGRDVHPVNSSGVFGGLIRLRDALRSDDQQAITRAAELLDANERSLIRVRGEVGARVQDFEARQGRMADANVSTKALQSELEDADFTEAITRFQTLQTSLQASMQATSQTLNLSLMDYL